MSTVLLARSPEPAVARGAGAGFVLVTGAVLVASVVLDLRTDPTGPGAVLALGPGWPYALLGPILAACATVILVRDPRQGFGWGLAWLGCFWALDGLAQSWVRFAIGDDEVLAGANLALWFLNRVGAFLPATVALLLLLFPTGRFLPGRWRVASWAAALAMLLSALVVVVAPVRGVPQAEVPGVDVNLGALALPRAVTDVALPLTIVASVAGLAVAMLSVVVRYRRSSGLDRDRMRWLLWAVLAMTVLIAVSFVADVGALQDVTVILVMAVPAAAMTVAIVDPTLVSIEELLGRTVLYGALGAILVVVDLVGLGLLSTLLGDRLEPRQAVLAVVLLTVLVYLPVRGRLTRWVRRLVLGSRADRYDAVSGLAATLETTDEGSEQLAAVARAVADAFRVPFVSVEVDRGRGERLVTTVGDRPAETRSLPISYRGESVGRLVLPARGLRSRLTARDEELLGDLVRQAATAARNSRLAEELQASRERLVLAREEERRRIRRDLHDGLGPALGGVVFQLESARLLLEREPERAREQLATTTTLVQDVVADVRRLVHDLRPPALDDRGLVGALGQQAERMSVAGPVTTVCAEDLGTLPAAVEVAAYRIVGEALTNVTRHAGATRVEVRLAVEGPSLVATVRDDGVGIADDTESGVGLLSMRERAAELGGLAEVTCPPDGGTLVRAELPLEEP
ncbi:GAF domain-containing sensor histidine kinase [Serinicoccus sediminis]|uniref:GAF domain-containing sensor histidine kinase n=1 Tax=Serinicoccus sediminis TaxID=2306021 RepID=UPI001020C535|nr:GAF domain-containing sensor histidine kinase [Serinicoccus sediminis]